MTRLLLAAALGVFWLPQAAADSVKPPDNPGEWLFLGNSMTRQGDIPGAIDAYLNGLRDRPDEPRLLRGLEFARARVAYATDEERAALAPRPDELAGAKRFLREWGLLAIAFANVGAWLALSRWVVTRRPRWLVVSGVSLAVALATVVGWLAERQVREYEKLTPVAVVAHSEILRRGNGPSFAPRRENPLPPGAEVRVHGRRTGWAQVVVADGTMGWLPQSALQP